jgi:DNA-binding NtrC family response regulator
MGCCQYLDLKIENQQPEEYIMPAKKQLSAQEREFFALVNQAVFANPFGDERVEIDLKIAGLFPGVPERERIDKAIAKIAMTMERFEKEGRDNINHYSGKDRRLIENSFLYDFFNQFIDHFDRHIGDQIEAGKTSLRVPFAGEAFAYLSRRGFNSEDIRRYFEVVYQLRRAYFFIDRSLVGRSPGMREVRRKLWNNVFTQDIEFYNAYLWDRMEDFSTLILGDTGTGKGTAAAAIGRSGFIPFDEKQDAFAESFTESFIFLNLSQFPENLIESELFGHKKGAFTGAVEDYEGIFDRCSRYGAILLDEIGEVSIPVQIKLLQVLQERVFSPVGSHDEHRFQGRVIAATNRPLEQLRGQGRMRDDFFYRLCSDIITVPPLHQRIQEDPGELDDLLAHTVQRLLGKPSAELSKMVRLVIDQHLGADYHWPGNVRELEQCVRQVLLNQVYLGDQEAAAQDLNSQLIRGIQNGNIEAQQLMAGYCFLLYGRHGTYEAVARRANLDRRTVKRYVDEWKTKWGGESV